MLSVALAMFRQLAPPVPHRRHWYEKSIGVEPVHVPGSAFRVWPSCAVPEIVGGEVLFGAAAAAAPAERVRPTTAAVAARPTTSAVPTSLDMRGSFKRIASSSNWLPIAFSRHEQARTFRNAIFTRCTRTFYAG